MVYAVFHFEYNIMNSVGRASLTTIYIPSSNQLYIVPRAVNVKNYSDPFHIRGAEEVPVYTMYPLGVKVVNLRTNER
jgi:hypothetical protein